MNAADMVRETAFVKPGDDVPDIGVNQQFEEAMEPLNNPNDIGEVIGVKGGFAIPMLVEKRDPRIPEFDEVKSKVADAIKQQRAKEQLEQKAKDLAASLSGRCNQGGRRKRRLRRWARTVVQARLVARQGRYQQCARRFGL